VGKQKCDGHRAERDVRANGKVDPTRNDDHGHAQRRSGHYGGLHQHDLEIVDS
jgi:hypothetical protein